MQAHTRSLFKSVDIRGEYVATVFEQIKKSTSANYIASCFLYMISTNLYSKWD